MKLARLAFVTVLLAGSALGVALAQDQITPQDFCFGVTHFPDDPVDDAPSKFTLGVTLDPMYAGGELTFKLDGPSGTQTGTGTVRPDGLAFAYAGLYTYGEHRMSEVELLVAQINRSLDDLDGELILVGDDEPMCDPSTLSDFTTMTSGAPAPPPTTTPTTTTTTTTTAAPVETTATPSTTAAPDETDEGGMTPWPIIFLGGGAVVAAGGAALAMSGKKNCDREQENVAAAQRRLQMINEPLEEALNDLAEHESELTSHEADLAAYNKAKQGGSTVDDNVRYFAYGGGRISEAEVDIQIEYYEGLLNIAREARDRDEARVREWHAKFERAQDEVRQAEEALAVCIGEGSAPAPESNPPHE